MQQRAPMGSPGRKRCSRLDSLLSASRYSPPRCLFSGVFAPKLCRDRGSCTSTSHQHVAHLLNNMMDSYGSVHFGGSVSTGGD